MNVYVVMERDVFGMKGLGYIVAIYHSEAKANLVASNTSTGSRWVEERGVCE